MYRISEVFANSPFERMEAFARHVLRLALSVVFPQLIVGQLRGAVVTRKDDRGLFQSHFTKCESERREGCIYGQPR
jgi:hypothetical protein